MTIRIGSARISENGNAGWDGKAKAGDQTGKEISMQNFYEHSKGWYVIRAKSEKHAMKIAENMVTLCNNDNYGYDQSERYGVVQHGVAYNKPSEADCSSSVRACVKEATGVDPGDFTTSNEKKVLLATGLFTDEGKYKSGMKLYTGDILVTCSKGHTVIVTSGYNRTETVKTTTTKGGFDVSSLPSISYGSNGAVVKTAQLLLIGNGYSCGKAGADKDFGQSTKNAVVAFQKAHGLTADGEIGPKTWPVLLGIS